MTFLKVNSNLRHNGDEFKIGTVFEAGQGEFQTLINSGVLSVIEGAETMEQAKELATQQPTTKAEESEVEASSPQDTWGPTKEPATAPVDDTQTENNGQSEQVQPQPTDETKAPEKTDSEPTLTGNEL